MRFGEVLTFRNDIFFEGAVQADWFYQPEKASLVSENFVFHGKNYFGVSEGTGGNKITDTAQFTCDIAEKVFSDQRVNPLTLAIAGYGTGKSHLAVTLAELLSGSSYRPQTYKTIVKNISMVDPEIGKKVLQFSQKPNLVLVINGMRDFNLHYELLKAAQKSLKLYGYSDEKLKTLNRALETAFRFFERNAKSSLQLFENYAPQFGYSEKGEQLISRIRDKLGDEEAAFNIINAVYEEINGHVIRWDEGVSASAVLETLLQEYCGFSGEFNRIVIIFDEFGRYLEYASSTTVAHSGDSALQQIFESAQNAEGAIQVINFIQADIKAYLQRVDQTSNISRYIGRYDASDKYRLSSNLETVFANLIERKDKASFDKYIKSFLNENESTWKKIYGAINEWLPAKGLWKDYSLFRKVVVEGIYPLHPLATYMLAQLSDYLQNRSSLMLLSRYVKDFSTLELSSANVPLVYPEMLLTGDLFVEMLSAEEEGRQYSQHCIRYNNILRKYQDKLSENSLKVLRANLAMRILRCRTKDYDDAKRALSYFSGLPGTDIDTELVWLENEYAVLGFDEHASCFDFLEDSSGAHDFRTHFRRLRAKTQFTYSIFEDSKIRDIADVITPQQTNFATKHKIKTNEWQFEQDLFPAGDLSAAFIDTCIQAWRSAVAADKIKGKLIWLYIDKETEENALDNAIQQAKRLDNTPIVLMLLNDTENKLKNALMDYIALNSMSAADKQKYGRHYLDKHQQTEDNIKTAFDLLKKQRLQVQMNGVHPMDARLAVSLTGVFDKIYPRAVPFDFDGFDSKQSGRARKAFCSIARLVLSGPISENTIHSFPSEIRNRLEATLFTTGAFSWKVIDENYNIIPPRRAEALVVYNTIVDELPEGGEASLDKIITALTLPPYGMNEYVAVYMLVTVCANLSYCLRVVLNGAVYSINTWKDEIINDTKIDISLIRKSVLKRVNAGAVTDLFLRLFADINSNTDIERIDGLKNELARVIQSESVPDQLNAQYLLAENKLQEGARIKISWKRALESVLEKYDRLLQSRDIYSGLQALQALNGTSFYQCFMGTSYAMSEDQRAEINSHKNRIRQNVEPFIKGWISEQRCKGVEYISQYRKHMDRICTLLKELGYESEASEAEDRSRKELSNVEEIKARQELKKDYADFIGQYKVTPNEPFTRLVEWEKYGAELLARIDRHAEWLGNDASVMKEKVETRTKSISDAVCRIKNDMNDIYDDMYTVKAIDDVKDMVSRINLVCQKGIPATDVSDFEELKQALEDFLSRIEALSEVKNERERFTSEYNRVLNYYESNELDFDVEPILTGVAKTILNGMDERERNWRAKYLDLISDDRSELLRWIDQTRVLPSYLSEKSINDYFEVKKKVDEKLSKAKVEDVIYSFLKLDKQEKAACFDQLVDIFGQMDKEGDNPTAPPSQIKPAKRIKWDFEEWVVLTDLYFKYSDKTRTQIWTQLEELSAMYKRRASALNIHYDEKYRNVNGLGMQFDRIKYIDSAGDRGLSAYSELAENAVKLYYEDRGQFDSIVKKFYLKYG